MRLPVIENKSNMRSETTETEDDETLCTGSGKNPSIVGDVEALSQEGTK